MLYEIARPLLFTLDPETAHNLTLQGLHYAGKLLPPGTPATTSTRTSVVRKRLVSTPSGSTATGWNSQRTIPHPTARSLTWTSWLPRWIRMRKSQLVIDRVNDSHPTNL